MPWASRLRNFGFQNLSEGDGLSFIGLECKPWVNLNPTVERGDGVHGRLKRMGVLGGSRNAERA